MLPELSKIKGVHPGAVLRRELKILNLKSSQLASQIDEHKQTISAILNKRRDINPKLSIKLSTQFDVEADYFMMLQAAYDVKTASENNLTPNLDKIRKAIFWDTRIDEIDWEEHKKAVIKRVLERGNTTEIEEIISFYGKQNVIDDIKAMKVSHLPAYEENIKEHDLI